MSHPARDPRNAGESEEAAGGQGAAAAIGHGATDADSIGPAFLLFLPWLFVLRRRLPKVLLAVGLTLWFLPAAFSGIAALLGMLTSCASGVTVVNIDNGFGAACAACKINNLIQAKG